MRYKDRLLPAEYDTLFDCKTTDDLRDYISICQGYVRDLELISTMAKKDNIDIGE